MLVDGRRRRRGVAPTTHPLPATHPHWTQNTEGHPYSFASVFASGARVYLSAVPAEAAAQGAGASRLRLAHCGGAALCVCVVWTQAGWCEPVAA